MSPPGWDGLRSWVIKSRNSGWGGLPSAAGSHFVGIQNQVSIYTCTHRCSYLSIYLSIYASIHPSMHSFSPHTHTHTSVHAPNHPRTCTCVSIQPSIHSSRHSVIFLQGSYLQTTLTGLVKGKMYTVKFMAAERPG